MFPGKAVCYALLITVMTSSHCEALPVDFDDDWFAIAQDALKAALKVKQNTNIAKNVILFIGDGMGPTSVTAGRIYKGQKDGKPGEETILKFEEFPYVALSKTYNVDRQVADSAATATAIMSGVKTRFGVVGVNTQVVPKDCRYFPGNEVDTILDWAHEKGKWTGVVTTTRLTHGTPGAAYGHVPWRYWEVDHAVPEQCRGTVSDLAKQLLVDNADIRVVLGGGRAYFLPKDGGKDPEYPDKTGDRHDGRNLIQEWEKYHKKLGHSYRYVWNRTSFEEVSPDKTDFLLGIFEPNNMQYELDRHADKAGEPSIAEMTEKAISLLSKSKEGYFLMVEGGRIDHAHHECNAKRALEDTIAFDDAIKRAVDITDESDTLIIVTADHSHTLTLGSHAARGNDILGFVDDLGIEYSLLLDDYPVTTLMYANGPGLLGRTALAGDVDPTADDFLQPVAVPMSWESHGGEDVAIYARGPMAHLIHGVQEQHYIAHVMAYASCVGANTDHCKGRRPTARSTSSTLPPPHQTSLVAAAILLHWFSSILS